MAEPCRRCGHDRAAHRHHSAAAYCGLCRCKAWRRTWPWRYHWRYLCALTALCQDAGPGISPAEHERLKAEAREIARQVRGG